MFKLLSNDPAKYERQRMYWVKTRERGRLRFVLTLGCVWGGFMFIFTSSIGIFLHNDKFYLSPLGITFGLLIWGAAGYSFGFWMWNQNEGRFGPTRKPPSIIEN
jgi:drug/metabolite transporter (DMT)-like permease